MLPDWKPCPLLLSGFSCGLSCGFSCGRLFTNFHLGFHQRGKAMPIKIWGCSQIPHNLILIKLPTGNVAHLVQVVWFLLRTEASVFPQTAAFLPTSIQRGKATPVSFVFGIQVWGGSKSLHRPILRFSSFWGVSLSSHFALLYLESRSDSSYFPQYHHRFLFQSRC